MKFAASVNKTILEEIQLILEEIQLSRAIKDWEAILLLMFTWQHHQYDFGFQKTNTCSLENLISKLNYGSSSEKKKKKSMAVFKE